MRPLVPVIVCAVAVSCARNREPGPTSPTSGTPTPNPTASAAPTPAPTPTPAASFSVDLPVALGDTAAAAFSIWPFGVHGSSHAFDGHPGFDVEFRPGASVRAAAEGTVGNIVPDPALPGRFSIRLNHSVGGRNYATDYTNLDGVAAGLSPGVSVTRGQVLGLAGVQSQIIGTTPTTWAMTHFQVNDFTQNEGLTNPNAVSSEVWLSPAARAHFAVLWAAAFYPQEFTEPFASNSRLTPFPLTRTWTAASGSVARIDFTRADPATAAHTYAIRTSSGDLVESGTATTTPRTGQSDIDLVTAGGSIRRGVYDILDRTMRLNLAAPGAPRPATLDGAVVFTMQ
jgi:hypothetical protein